MAEPQNKKHFGWPAAIGIGTVIGFAANTRPEDAVSNISAWLEYFGLDYLSTLFNTPYTDTIAFTAAIALVAVGVTYRMSRGWRDSMWSLFRSFIGPTKRGRMIFLAASIIAVCAVGGALGVWLLHRSLNAPPDETSIAETQKTPPETKEKKPPQLKYANLLELMHAEHAPGNMQHTREMAAPLSADKKPLIVTIDLNQDPRSGSEFLAIHVPPHEYTFKAIAWFMRNHETILEQIKKDGLGSVSIQGAGEQSPPTTEGARFTGKLYVYYNVTLPLQKLADLEKLAESRDLRVTFRDHTYWMTRNQVEKE